MIKKAAFVLGGYVTAFLLGCAAVWLNEAMMSPAVSNSSSGMAAFGDVLLFVGVFGFVSLIPTAAAAFFIWEYWRRSRQKKLSDEKGGVMEVKECPVHKQKLKTEDVPVEYGLIKHPPEYIKALDAEFPWANSNFEAGCIDKGDKTASVQYCSACRNARRLWLSAHQ